MKLIKFSCLVTKDLDTLEKPLQCVLILQACFLVCLFFVYSPLIAQDNVEDSKAQQEVLQEIISQQESSKNPTRMMGNRPKLILTQEVFASDREMDATFGRSVALNNKYAVVGANYESKDENGLNPIDRAGAAYIYKRDGSGNWLEIQKIVAPNREQSPGFGRSVAMYEDFIIVGAENNSSDENGDYYKKNTGAAYIFKRNSSEQWEYVQKLVTSDAASDDYFGRSLAISNGVIVVAAPLKSGNGADGTGYNIFQGAIYVYEPDAFGTWNQVQKLVASDREARAQFGNSISMSESTIVVGALYEDKDEHGEDIADSPGAVYIFEKDPQGMWNESQKLVSSDRADGDYFGASVAVYGKDLVIGAFGEDENAQGTMTALTAGAAYIFERDPQGTWVEVQKIVPKGRRSGDYFGSTVAISGNRILIGADRDDLDEDMVNNISYSGAIHEFIRNAAGTWSNTQRLKNTKPGKFEYFGRSVALYGRYALAGTLTYKDKTIEEDEQFPVGLVSFYDTSFTPEPEITVSSEVRIIANGDTTPALADNTNFGLTSIPETRTFTIDNKKGSAELMLTGTTPAFVEISGSTDFVISSQPSTNSIPVGESVTFEVIFTPTLGPRKTAVVTISNNDRTESSYTFTVGGKFDNSVIQDLISESQYLIKLHPNPVKNTLSINVDSDIRIEKLFVYDSLGTLIREDTFGSNNTRSLNLQHLPTGHYIIQFHTVKGEVVTRHFIKM